MGVARHPPQPQRRDATMQERTKVEEEDRERTDWLTEFLRSSARELIATALKTEVDELVASYAEQRYERARAVVVRNGHHAARAIQTGIGPVTVQVPKVRSRQGKPVTFRSGAIVESGVWSELKRRGVSGCNGCCETSTTTTKERRHDARAYQSRRGRSRTNRLADGVFAIKCP